MTRSTIDFGIDLGTTNSAIAVVNGVGVDILKNNNNADITPSVVGIRKALHVGERARNLLIDYPDDAYGEFKRRMGTDYAYAFKASGLSRQPEELSAEVLKSLCGDAQNIRGENVNAAVITVPAAFELHQCDATAKAARLAGLHESPLLQEPVAAALAFGFQVDDRKAYWLVYDFGGGTFDAAIIKADDGTLQVVNHGGDNFLGGSDIDRAIVANLIIPQLRKEPGFEAFEPGEARWRHAYMKLKRAAELAKIELSRPNQSFVLVERLPDGNGQQIEFECEITRDQVLSCAEPYIDKSVDICRRVLAEKKLRPSDIERVILVGGPTLAPYFREKLKDVLGIAIDHSVDPMTVVARGAAIFAGAQRLKDIRPKASAAGTAVVELRYQPVGIDDSPQIGGKVALASIADFSGMTIELINSNSQWSSGKVALRKDGVFITNVRADRGVRNEYSIVLRDTQGRRLATEPNSFHYTIGAGVGAQPLINSLGISTAANDYDRLFNRGDELPLKKAAVYLTIRPVKKGMNSEAIVIPIVEGESQLGDRNRLVGAVKVEGTAISRDLPAGSEIELTIKVDESRIITAEAYVPILEQEFPTKIDLGRKSQAPEELTKEYETELKRLAGLEQRATAAGATTVRQRIDTLEASPMVTDVRHLVELPDDPDAMIQLDKRLVELKGAIDGIADALELPSVRAEARNALEALTDVDRRWGSADHHQKVAALVAACEALLRKENAGPDLRKRTNDAWGLYFAICDAQPAFWVEQLQWIEKGTDRIADKARASKLLDQGRAFISQNNVDGLRNVVKALWDLMPAAVVESAQRGYGSGVLRQR